MAYEARTCWQRIFASIGEVRIIGRSKTCKLDLCDHCVLDKRTKVKFGTAINCTKGLLNYVHMDIWGLTRTASLGGHRYFVFFLLMIYLGGVACTL